MARDRKISFVGNIPWEATEEEIKQLFENHGTVEDVRFIYDRETDRFRGIGFVTMSTPEEAREAERALNGHEIQNRTLKVDEAHDERPRRPKSLR